MKKITLLLLLLTTGIYAQKQDEILAEAWLLYNSERASWHGSDIFMERFSGKSEAAGGYLSYTEDNKHTCIFFDRQQEPRVLVSITFDDSFVVEAAKIDTTERGFTTLEKDLHVMRQKALNEVQNDTLFKFYEKVNPNFIPLIINKEKKVYILSGPTEAGLVIFGNDYLLTFDKDNKLKTKKALHKNIIPITYSDDPDENVTMHSHKEETGHLITATDICTLMLYCPYTNWDQHYVISKKNVSIWSCENNKLLVMTRKAWEAINEVSKQKDN